ncbi:MAG: hypothetical protein IKT40_03535 [Bacilli bacterium]|nr:hypothetical protein [Bacilli bacterium]
MSQKQEIKAKDIYAYAHMCVDIQKMNIETYNNEVARAERVMRENPNNREAVKTAKTHKYRFLDEIKKAKGKIEILENVISVIHTVYEKNDDKLEFEDGELEKMIEFYLPEELKEESDDEEDEENE